MSNYTLAVSWSGKDALADSDANKVISGADFNTEFTAVQTAVNTKADLAGNASQAFAAVTASAGTNTTQVATTAFVYAEAATKQDTLGTSSNGYGTRTVGTGAASGGSDGDIHYQVAS
jgi:hypothetical protein